ncbi:Oidioi.mRNA.OKI2018_I69.XSR.g14372.t1.cds [Oikopleura dioica]|uniref:Oidioi.mRNA.OKI2018_I69.XSR.g14372.t1.cds n=1 Tax=Oikopleura dioica TaxID=34765 RepID=A0ABN7SBD4_OIKDI|nr:Oidioi.mRNA.OKI2018_I69.XSR.g14372.t1.cds [Oikopleura dioica]
MKADIETVESEDAKKLKIREEKLCEKERIIAKERAEFENEKANFKGSRAAREGSQESPGMTLELQNALEECVVLRQEKQTLLERCNKLSHELKRATRSLENGAAASEEKDRPLSAVENLQYELTKKQLGLVALERHRVPYNPTEYTGSACDLPTHENSFLDSEVVSLSSLPNTELSQFEAEDVPVKLPSRKQFKRPLPRQPINYNSLKPTT